MSEDTVDDLHQAEDLLAMMVGALEGVEGWKDSHPYTGLADATSYEDNPMVGVIAALEEFAQYCRPSCGWRDDGQCLTGEDTCGCPCNHGQPEPETADAGANRQEAPE